MLSGQRIGGGAVPKSPTGMAARKERGPRVVQAKPAFHVQPAHGWLNDPNGIHWDPATKMYHMFFQHHPRTSQWSWGLSWGHAVSEDLLHWSHLPPALDPTPGPEGRDSGGVWSGCAFPTDEGTVLLHTAVRKRDETPAHLMPPQDKDLGNEIIESQQFAVAKAGQDPLLLDWTKGENHMIPLPPQGGLTGWRDPFLVGRPGDGVHDEWVMIVGSGYKDSRQAAALVYTSNNPTSGWKYEGELCRGDGSTGAVWECPVFTRVKAHPDHVGQAGPDKYMLAVCPDYAHFTPVYYLGDYDPKTKKFDIQNAAGPYPLDLGGGPQGCTFYAPNVLTNDPHGRLIMWGWCQETGRPGDPALYDYGSCLSLPRLIWRHPYVPGMLWQEPLPTLTQLRCRSWCLHGADSPTWTETYSKSSSSNGNTASINVDARGGNGGNGNGSITANGGNGGAGSHLARVNLKPGHHVQLPLELGAHPHLELELTLEPPTSLPAGTVAKTGLLIHPNLAAPITAHEASGRNGAALLYDWRHARLEVVFSDGMEDLSTLCAAPAITYDAMNRTSRTYPSEAEAKAGEAILDQGKSTPATQAALLHETPHKPEGDMDAEHRPLDVRGCHTMGSQLTLWPGMGGTTGSTAAQPGAAHSKAAVGGVLQPIKLRVFLDHSLLEAFTSTGQVLTTRVYHQEDKDHPDETETAPPCLELASFGVDSGLRNVSGHILEPIWPEASQADQKLEGIKERAASNFEEFSKVAEQEKANVNA